jgi:Ca2+-binding EF-hand superfamily protein
MLVSAAPLIGRIFQSDTQKVYHILKSDTVRTDEWEWIKVYDSNQDGHLAFKALREHYDGPGEINKRISLTRTQIKKLFYKNEQTFSFEKFITKLNGAFQMLAECHEDLMEKNMVDHMITAMLHCSNSAIIAATTTILMNPEMQNNFLAAANKMTGDCKCFSSNTVTLPGMECCMRTDQSRSWKRQWWRS